MPFPQYPDKWRRQSLVQPADYAAYARQQGTAPEAPLPPTMFLIFSRSLLEELALESGPYFWNAVGPDMFVAGDPPNASIGITLSGIGAPAAAVLMEELIVYGARRVIVVGTAGALSRRHAVGDLVVCRQAIRDEGVSHHYDIPGRWALPDAGLTHLVSGILTEQGLPNTLVMSWTTDAPYRETLEEVEFYIRQGVTVVEMEAAALMTVAKLRGVAFASVFVASDRLNPENPENPGLSWEPMFHEPVVARAKLDALQALMRHFGEVPSGR